MEGNFSLERFGDFILDTLTPDYNFVRNTSLRDREFGLEDVKPTMRSTYADLQSRSSSTSLISGRSVTMQAQEGLIGLQCYIYGNFGHAQGGLPQIRP